jgi:4-hydroxy-tetrahydrodipicolinate synthase
MDLPRLHGIVPPLPTPLRIDESIDTEALAHLVDFQVKAGVHGLWILGTTARFDLIPDPRQRQVAEVAAQAAAGRVPMVLNVSDQGTGRTLARARMFDDLPYDYYAALPPWYQAMTPGEVADYFLALADRLARPLVIYNAPWVCNQLSFPQLRQLAGHPRIVGCKDVGPSLSRALDWPVAERRGQGFSYLHGTDLLANSTDLGADGFVCSLSNPFPELAVAIWEAARDEDAGRAFRLQSQFSRLGRATGFGPMHACLEVMCRHRGLLQRMLPAPLRPLDAETARRVVEVIESVGVLPDEPAVAGGRQHFES